MAKRLQVILQDQECRGDPARSTVPPDVDCRVGATGAGARPPPRTAGYGVDKKLATRFEQRLNMSFPRGDIETMLAEIEQGYLTDRQP